MSLSWICGKEQYILVDMVSNLAGGGWTVVTDAGTYGQSGLVYQADTTSAAVPINVVSMYRNITYDNVTKDHKKDNSRMTGTEQLGAILGGGAQVVGRNRREPSLKTL